MFEVESDRPSLKEVVWEKWTGLTPGKLGTILIGWIYTRIILDIIVCALQVRKDWYSTQVPETFRFLGVTQARFDHSRNYRLHKHYAKIGGYLYILAVIHYIYIGKSALSLLWDGSGVILNFLGVWPDSWDPEIGLTIVFIIIATLFFNGVDFPIKAFDVFVVEESFGFNTQTFGFFIVDQLKLWASEVCLELPIGISIVYIVKLTPHFYWFLWTTSAIVLGFFIIVYPRWIAPIFDKQVPLPEGSLRRSITELATRCGFPLEDILILKDSKRSAHSHAYFEGSSRIVLSENIFRKYLSEHPAEDELVHRSRKSRADFHQQGLDQGVDFCTDDEIVALVAHDMGHWKAYHLWWNVGLAFVNLFCLFGTFSAYYTSSGSSMYEVFKFPTRSKKPILLGLFIVFNHIMDTVNFATDLGLRYVARTCHLSADKFAVRLGYGDHLKKAVLKTNVDNLNIGEFNPIYIYYFLDRPPLGKRLRLIDAELAKMR